MLIVHPNSSCDVCLEQFGRGSKSPHSISCGHVFCLGCLESITSGACPLCRDRFHPLETRKLHIDLDSQVNVPSTTAPLDATQEARRLQDSIARIVKDGSSESHLRALIEECSAFLKTQHRGHHEDLRVSFRMISYLCDVKSNLKKQTEGNAKLETEYEALQKRLTVELDDSERKYQELVQTRSDEREAALAVEKSLRDHYSQLMVRCKAAEVVCETLTHQLSLLRGESRQDKPILSPIQTEDDDIIDAKANRMSALYLSPLPEVMDPLPSSLKSFIALPEVDYEFDKVKKSDPLPFAPDIPDHESRLSSEPLLRNDTYISRTQPISMSAPPVSSGLSLTNPQLSDLWDRDSRSLRRVQDVQMGSPKGSCRSSRHSSPSPFRKTAGTKRQHSDPDRDYTRDRGHSFASGANEPEQLRSQLHDLLSNPAALSLPNMSHFPQNMMLQVQGYSSSPPRSASSVSQRPTPGILAAPIKPPVSTTITPPPPHSHNPTQRPVISHAMSVAMEKERLKAEKEKLQVEKDQPKSDKEQQRRQLTAGASTTSLRQPPSIYPITRVSSSGTKRDATNVYGTSTVTGNVNTNSLREATNVTTSRGRSESLSVSLRDSTNAYAQQYLRHQDSIGSGAKRARLPVQNLFA